MFQQVTIYFPTMQLIIELATSYFIIGFFPWFAWCLSDVCRDYGRSWSSAKFSDYFRLVAAWILWPISIDVTRRNLTYRSKSCK